MSENYTFEGYLGSGYQEKLLWQILTEPEFTEQIFPFIQPEYWDDNTFKRYYLVMREYTKEYGRIPNLQNKSIYQAISKFKRINDVTDEETLLALTEKIKSWNDMVLNKNIAFDGDSVQKGAFSFIRQGEYAGMAKYVLENLKLGKLNEDTLDSIEEKIKKIGQIGVEDDDGVDIFENIDSALQEEYRDPTPTGIATLDTLMGGGLGKGEMGIFLAPSGVGKTTFLSLLANHSFTIGKKVLQIVFEDTVDEVRRKHYAIWSKYKLSEIDQNRDDVREQVVDIQNEISEKGGKLIIKKFSQEDTTIPKIRKWIDRYRKKTGINFDIVLLDYLDCVEPHKKGVDQNAIELQIVKAFEAMAGDYNIPCWSALQTNRSGFGAEFIRHENMGGNIKRAQKTHFLMSGAKTADQKRGGMANLVILKARFAQDGQEFENVIFNNDQVRIRIDEGCYVNTERVTTVDVDKLNDSASEVSVTSEVNDDSEITDIEEITTEKPELGVDEELINMDKGMSMSNDSKKLIQDKLNQMRNNEDIMKKKKD
jgi:replicative DNA helicase